MACRFTHCGAGSRLAGLISRLLVTALLPWSCCPSPYWSCWPWSCWPWPYWPWSCWPCAVLALVLLALAVLALVLLALAVLALVLLALAVLALVLLALAVLALVLLAALILLAALVPSEFLSTSPSTCCSASCSRLPNSLTGPSVLTAAVGRPPGTDALPAHMPYPGLVA